MSASSATNPFAGALGSPVLVSAAISSVTVGSGSVLSGMSVTGGLTVDELSGDVSNCSVITGGGSVVTVQQALAGASISTPVTREVNPGSAQDISYAQAGPACFNMNFTENCTLTLTGGTLGQKSEIDLFMGTTASSGVTVTLPSALYSGMTSAATTSVTLSSGQSKWVKFATADGGVTDVGAILA